MAGYRKNVRFIRRLARFIIHDDADPDWLHDFLNANFLEPRDRLPEVLRDDLAKFAIGQLDVNNHANLLKMGFTTSVLKPFQA